MLTQLLAVGACCFAQPDPVDPGIGIDHVVAGLGMGHQQLTVGVVFVDDDTLLGVNRADGAIRRIDLVDGRTVDPGPVIHDLDIIAPKIGDSQTEYGVQAIALHPDFDTNQYVYLRYDKSLTPGRDTPQMVVAPDPNFSASDPTENVIERYVWDPDANGGTGSLTFDSTIYTIIFDTRYHHGGPINFDSGAHLYTFVGDLRHQPFIDGHFGKLITANYENELPYDAAVILRLEDDGSIPPDNPFDFDDPDVPPEAAPWFAYGVRNSFGLAFDPVTGDLWDTDNGEAQWDEINRVEPGFNGGSLDIMGPVDHEGQTGNINGLAELPGSSYNDPRFTWATTFGITGIHFLAGSALGPDYDHLVLVGAVLNTLLWAMPLDESRTGFTFKHEALQDLVDDRPNSSEDPIGTTAEEIFFAHGFGIDGAGIIAITRGPDDLPYVLTATGDLYRITTRCAADFDEDGALTILDFIAFQQAFTNAHPSADCDKNGTLNILDFVCFQTTFQAGCI
jgi:glucose/arabinose dehydrogenase